MCIWDIKKPHWPQTFEHTRSTGHPLHKGQLWHFTHPLITDLNGFSQQQPWDQNCIYNPSGWQASTDFTTICELLYRACVVWQLKSRFQTLNAQFIFVVLFVKQNSGAWNECQLSVYGWHMHFPQSFSMYEYVYVWYMQMSDEEGEQGGTHTHTPYKCWHFVVKL